MANNVPPANPTIYNEQFLPNHGESRWTKKQSNLVSRFFYGYVYAGHDARDDVRGNDMKVVVAVILLVVCSGVLIKITIHGMELSKGTEDYDIFIIDV